MRLEAKEGQRTSRGQERAQSWPPNPVHIVILDFEPPGLEDVEFLLF